MNQRLTCNDVNDVSVTVKQWFLGLQNTSNVKDRTITKDWPIEGPPFDVLANHNRDHFLKKKLKSDTIYPLELYILGSRHSYVL